MEVSMQVSGLERYFPGKLFQGECPTRTLLDHVTSKWGVLVLVALSGRTARWSELRRDITGVSEKMLAQTLQTLERDRLVARHARAVIPPHVEYTLTSLGEEVVERLLPLMQWVAEHAEAVLQPSTVERNTMEHEPSGRER
jgi:DNA-binding HxlR family transcriptional regulator